jgi:hypothetical protein
VAVSVEPRPRRLRRGLAAGAIVLLVAIAAWWLLIRDSTPSPGPLGSNELGVSDGISTYKHVGDSGFGHAAVINRGTKPAVLDAIRLVDATPGLEVVSTHIAGLKRKDGGVSFTDVWPSSEFSDLHPVAGFVVPPSTEPGADRGVELVFRLRTRKPGIYETRSVAVDYEVGGSKHQATVPIATRLCVIPADQPLRKACGQPTTMG